MSEPLNYIQLLQQPEFISKTDVQLFHNWVDESPFVPIYRVLLAAKYQSLDHSDTAQYIEQAAFYVQDRKQLKLLLRKWSDLQIEPISVQDEAVVIPIDVHQEQSSTISDSSTATENDAIIEDESIEEEENALSQETPIDVEITETVVIISHTEVVISSETSSLEEVAQEEEIIQEYTPIESSEESIEVLPEVEVVNNEEPIVEEIISTPLVSDEEDLISEQDDIEFLKAIGKYEAPIKVEIENSNWILEAPGNTIPTISENDIIDAGLVNSDIEYLMPWINEFEFNFIQKDKILTPSKEAKTTPIEIVQAPKEIQVKTTRSKTVAKKEVVAEVKPAIEKEKSDTKNHSFDEWLSILDQKKNSEAEAPVFDLPSPEVFTQKELAQEKEESVISDNSNLQEKQSKEESEDVKQLAADSVSYKNDMGTETLAKLYVLQGKTDLAIRIYQKLMVKFPKKNSYFASQIEKIKK
ncbi:MAG TPA: hypothetical protein VLZ75_00410 [Chitinophagales bacterium]|nr:hypothetical protein [Chitinophagales bacterium]